MPDVTLTKYKLTYLVEIQYFPVIDWFKMSSHDLYYEIEQCETFQKTSFRNRCIISGSNGLINLTVPLQNGREQKALIRDVRIDNTSDWAKRHWRAIVSSYNRSPFFEYFAEDVNRMIFKKHDFLFDKNLEIIEWLKTVLKWNAVLGFTGSFQLNYSAGEIIDLRNNWRPNNYSSKADIKCPQYIQVFEDKFGFLPNLSILDLLFCKGTLL